MMDKPLSIRYVELKQTMADLINRSGLPAFVIESMMMNFARELAESAAKQYQYDVQQYSAMMAQLNAEAEQRQKESENEPHAEMAEDEN